MCNNSFHAFFYFVFYTLTTTFFLQITLNCRENDLLLDRYKNGEEKNFDSRRSNKWYLEFVKEENNDSDDDLKDLIGEDVDMEVAYDYNMETGDLEETQREAESPVRNFKEQGWWVKEKYTT